MYSVNVTVYSTHGSIESDHMQFSVEFSHKFAHYLK